MAQAPAGDDLPDWGAPGPRLPLAASLVPVAAAVALVAGAGAAAYLWLGRAAAVATTLIVATALFGWWYVQDNLALAAAGARRLREDEEPRLRNVVRGLCRDLGMSEPRLWVIEDAGPNAIVCPSRGGSLGVTSGLLDAYGATELEAVVAHCLLRLHHKQPLQAGLASAFGPLARNVVPAPDPVDVAATAVTRYPPGLAAAIEKASPRGGRFAPFWFVGDRGGSATQHGRASALLDL